MALSQRSASARGPQEPPHDSGYPRARVSKSSIHSDIGTYSGSPLSDAASAVASAASTAPAPSGAASPLPAAAGFLRLRPPREPRRDRLRFGVPSEAASPGSAGSAAGSAGSMSSGATSACNVSAPRGAAEKSDG